MPDPITYFGFDALTQALDWLRNEGVKRPLLISGPAQRFVDEVEKGLDGMKARRFSQAEVHVPRAKVEAVRTALTEHDADAIVTVGGGSATGLAKALRLETSLPFVAIPTTYAGSEMTRIYGITDEGNKQTGRDDRVRADVVAYVPEFLDTLSRRLTVQSLINAMAHPMSALSSDPLDEKLRTRALAVMAQLYRAILMLADRPRHRQARVEAARGASAAAQILDAHRMGRHHRVVHVLGARFGLAHAAVHAALLPASIAALRRHSPELYRAILDALPEADPLATLFDTLVAVGGASSLAALGVAPKEVHEAIEDTLGPQAWVQPALLGRRPSRHVRWCPWDHGAPLSVHGELETATDVVLAVHGRASTADAIVQRSREIVGDAPGVAIVAPQAPGGSWSEATYRSAWADDADGMNTALETLLQTRAWIEEMAPHAQIHLLGFSQGACLSFELLTRECGSFASVIALAGARVGPAEDRPALGDLHEVPVLVGVAQADPWIDATDFEETVAELVDAGATVETMIEPGDIHEIGGRQRIRARELLLGTTNEGDSGFGNTHAVEALPGALPRTQNSPRRGSMGLYAEQWNGTGFLATRSHNLRTWVYRIRPSAGHRPFVPLLHPTLCEDYALRPPAINLVGHRPLAFPEAPTDFVDGLHTYGGQGRAAERRGFAVHLYAANRSMEHRAYQNSDGDLLLLPQEGALTLRTELGVLDVAPGELAIIPRGIAFSVLLQDDRARGYVGEVYGRHFELPDRGVVGANGLADARHFRTPTPWFENRPDPGFRFTTKMGGQLYQTTLDRSPFDVVAWHGNYTPYAYDLALFSPVSNVAYDHIDPSAYTVVTAPLDERGAHGLDLVVFPPRWDTTAHTFRPPFFHRNAATEINGILRTPATDDSMFQPGACFLTPTMTAHGVVDRAVERAMAQTDERADAPARPSETSLWFQFESALQLSLSSWAESGPARIDDWPDQWGRYRSHYDPPSRDPNPA